LYFLLFIFIILDRQSGINVIFYLLNIKFRNIF